MIHSVAADRRQDRRYLAVVIETAKGQAEAALVNIGPSGLLAFCDAKLAEGEQVSVRFTAPDRPLLVRVQGRVAHAEAGLTGIRFLKEPETLSKILRWLQAGSLAYLPV